MTVVAVLAEPPRPGVLSRVAEETPLSAEGAATLYEATLSDAVRSVAKSGGDLLVNYRPADGDSRTGAGAEESRPDERWGDDAGPDAGDPEKAVRTVVEAALADLERDPHAGEPRYEPQVGSTPAARVGNTVTHVLREEGAESAAVLRPTAPLASRTAVDGAAMKLRSATTVLGPTTGGDVYYAGFTAPVDFEDALSPPAVGTLTERTAAAEGGTDFIEVLPSVETPAGLALTTTLVRSRRRAGRRVPAFTAAAIATLGLRAVEDDGGLTVETE